MGFLKPSWWWCTMLTVPHHHLDDVGAHLFATTAHTPIAWLVFQYVKKWCNFAITSYIGYLAGFEIRHQSCLRVHVRHLWYLVSTTGFSVQSLKLFKRALAHQSGYGGVCGSSKQMCTYVIQMVLWYGYHRTSSSHGALL